MGVVTVTVSADDPDPYAAMQTSGSCAILVALGLASLAPWLLRHLSVVARPLVPAGVAGHLAAYNTRRRAHLLAGVLAPVIVLTAAAISTLMVVGADGRTLPGRQQRRLRDDQPAQQRRGRAWSCCSPPSSWSTPSRPSSPTAGPSCTGCGCWARRRSRSRRPCWPRPAWSPRSARCSGRSPRWPRSSRSASPGTRASSPTASSGCRRWSSPAAVALTLLAARSAVRRAAPVAQPVAVAAMTDWARDGQPARPGAADPFGQPEAGRRACASSTGCG